MSRNWNNFEVDEAELEGELEALNEEMAIENLDNQNLEPPSYLPSNAN